MIRKIDSQHYRVEEIPQQRFGLRLVTSGRDTSYGKIVLARVSAEQSREPRQQGLKKRDSLFPAQGLHSVSQAGTQGERIHTSTECLNRGTWIVGRQIQHRQII